MAKITAQQQFQYDIKQVRLANFNMIEICRKQWQGTFKV